MLIHVSGEFITSTSNPLLKSVRRAVARGALTRDGYMVAETPHLLEEALRSGCEIGAVLVGPDARVAAANDLHIIELNDALFGSVAATEAPQGVIALVRPRVWRMQELLTGNALVVVLDGVQDPGNAGTILRSAEAFGATGVIFLKGTVSPYNPKSVRASAGSVFRVPLVTGVTPDEARAALGSVDRYAASARGAVTATSAGFVRPSAIIIGAEGAGISERMSAGAVGVSIPTAAVESLNAATAAAILLYEARRQRTSA